MIALGINTDAFQPIEREIGLTRELLTILSEHNHPVSLLTKSALIQKYTDLIAPMAEKGLCRVGISITTLDRKLARTMEPRAATPPKTVRDGPRAQRSRHPCDCDECAHYPGAE